MKKILKNTWGVLTEKERKRFTILIILDIFISLVDILSLALLLWIIKFYIEPDHTSLSFLRGVANRNSVLLIAIFFFLFGIKNMAAFLISRAGYKFISSVAIRISHNNLVNYQQSEFEEFINVDSSVHIRRIGYQPFEFCQYMLSGTQQIITQSFLILLTIIAIVLFNAKLFLLLLIILLPPVVAVFYYIKKRLNVARTQIRSSNERSFQYLLDALKGYVEANIYNRNDFFLQRFTHHRKKFSAHLFDSISLQNMPNRVIEIFAVMGLFILVAIAKWTGNNDSGALITIGAFMAAAYKIIPGIVKLINASGQMRAYEFSITDLVQPGVKEKKDKERSSYPGICSIEMKKISFQYPKLPVLKDFNLSLEKGDFIGITGESGKGKTTILNLLLGFLTPSQGEIYINDIPADKETIKNYWPSIAYTRQQSFFIHDTILRNITLEEKGFNKENLQSALKISGVDELINKFPGGLDHIITENGKNISGGQQQRIALARAIYKNADLVLLDEPFNELDEGSEVLILEHFRELAKKNKLVLLITHNKKVLSYCNKIISLDEQ